MHAFGGRLKKLEKKLVGINNFEILKQDPLFFNIHNQEVFEAHQQSVVALPSVLVPLAKSQYGYEIIKHKEFPVYGFQFHPEVLKDDNGGHILVKNFISLYTKI